MHATVSHCAVYARHLACALALALALAGCGGSDASQAHRAATLVSAGSAQTYTAYITTVQQLYIAYFGRPADPGGLANFTATLANLNAPTDLPGLDAEYDRNPAVRALVDQFGTSEESKALYSGDAEAFIRAIYRNVLGRDPDAGGLAFWSGAVASGALSKGKAALSIMAGALTNTSAQGQLDAQTVANKVAVGAAFTSSLTMPVQLDAYQGNAAAAVARAMLANVSNATSATAFQSGIDAAIAVLLTNSPSAEYIVDTVVGNGAPNLGDGGLATSATLTDPERVLVSATGAVYIADTNNDRVRVVDTNGIIRTFAGSGSAESQTIGDGGPATQAAVRFPRALFETPDRLYIGDHTYTVRFVDKTGTINHFALDRGDFIYPWSIVADQKGSVYLADSSHHRVLRADPGGAITTIAGTGSAGNAGDGGPAALAQLDSPSEIRFDGAGRLLVGSANAPLRQIYLATGLISTRLQQHMPYFDIDGAGNIAYTSGNRVLRVDGQTGAEHVVAGTGTAGFSGDGGAAGFAQLNQATGVGFDPAGNIYVADSGNNRVRKIATNGTISTFAGNGTLPAVNDSITDTQGMAFDSQGNLFFTDFQNHRLKRVGADGTISIVAGTGLQTSSGDGGAARDAAFSNPCRLVFDKHGRLYFLDLTGSGGSVRMIAPGADGQIQGAADETIATIAGRNISRDLYADHGQADGGAARQAVFVAARYFLFDSRGNLIIADWLDHRIRRVTPGSDGVFNGDSDEIITTIAGNGKTGQDGDGGLALNATVEAPTRMAIDAADNLYVYVGVNTAAHAIRRIEAKTGVITTVVAGADVADMVITRSNELIYTNYSNQVIRLDLATNRSTIIAGTGTTGFSGDGADARYATFKGASYLALDASDNVYIADNGNFRIRRLRKRH